MCGIFGVFRFDGSAPFEDYKQSMSKSAEFLARRGPDFSGFWSTKSGECSLFHTRLSIIDTSDAGNQPFVTDHGSHALCYNGEIYNFVELRRSLPYVSFTSTSDTEVLHWGLVSNGIDFIKSLDGMFAFGFYSKDRHSLLLARDRMGQKPLYYAVHMGHFCFASDLRVFSHMPGFRFELEVESIADYLCFQQVPAPRTIFRNVFKLEPGYLLEVDRYGSIRRKSYLDDLSSCADGSGAAFDCLEQVQNSLRVVMDGAIERTLRADVDLGCFLSGGIDSSLVSAFSRKGIGRDLKTFSVGFIDDPSCELTEARRISTVLGTQHTEVMVYPTDYLDLLGAVVDQFDEPNSDPSCIPTFKVSQTAKGFVDVVLTGDGLDELFGGYTRYLSSLDAYAANRDAINRGEWHLGIDYSRRVHPFHEKSIKQLFGSIPKSFGANLQAFYYQIDHSLVDPARSFMGADIRFYLPSVLSKVDRMTMAHSLEARSPFLCNELIDISRKLDSSFLFRDGTSKYILRRLFSELIDPKMAWLPKKGFANSSSNERIVSLVRERLVSRLGDSRSFLSSVFGRDFWEVLNPILQSRSFYRMWSLLVLEEWISHIQSKERMCIDYV